MKPCYSLKIQSVIPVEKGIPKLDKCVAYPATRFPAPPGFQQN